MTLVELSHHHLHIPHLTSSTMGAESYLAGHHLTSLHTRPHHNKSSTSSRSMLHRPRCSIARRCVRRAIQCYMYRLRQLVPAARQQQPQQLSKVDLLRHVMDYIVNLEMVLEQVKGAGGVGQKERRAGITELLKRGAGVTELIEMGQEMEDEKYQEMENSTIEEDKLLTSRYNNNSNNNSSDSNTSNNDNIDNVNESTCSKLNRTINSSPDTKELPKNFHNDRKQINNNNNNLNCEYLDQTLNHWIAEMSYKY